MERVTAGKVVWIFIVAVLSCHTEARRLKSRIGPYILQEPPSPSPDKGINGDYGDPDPIPSPIASPSPPEAPIAGNYEPPSPSPIPSPSPPIPEPPAASDYGEIIIDYGEFIQEESPPSSPLPSLPPPEEPPPTPNQGSQPPPSHPQLSPPPTLSPASPAPLPPPPMPPSPPAPIEAPQKSSGKRKLKFSVYFPRFYASLFSKIQEEWVVTAVQVAALAAGSNKPPTIKIVKILASEPPSRKLLQSAGALVNIEALFDPKDGSIALFLADKLRTEPSRVFPVGLFGAVSVPDVQVDKSFTGGQRAGIAVGCTLFIGIMGGIVGVVAVKSRRKRVANSAPGGRASQQHGRKTWLDSLATKMKRPAKINQKFTTPTVSSLPAGEDMRGPASPGNEDDLSLRELYAAKQKMAELEGRTLRGSPPPSLQVSPRPSVVKPSSSSHFRGSVVVFDNPLAEYNEDECEMVAAEIKPSSSTSVPLSGWFKEARQKAAEKKAMSRLNKRQSFKSDAAN